MKKDCFCTLKILPLFSFTNFCFRSDNEVKESTNKALKEVTEDACELTRTDEVSATPFYTSDTGVIVIKGGKIVNHDNIVTADVLIEEGKITALGDNLEIPDGAAVINATGKFIMPGGVDMETHLYRGVDAQAPVMDDFESGSRKALLGGTTTIVDLVIPKKGESLVETFKEWKKVGERNSLCDFGLTVALPEVNEGIKKEMEILARDFGVNSFKLFMTYKNLLMLDNKQLMEAFKHVKDLGCIAKVHAENGDMVADNEKKLLKEGIRGPEGHLLARPEEVEEEAVRRACTLSLQANNPLHVCGVSSTGAVDIIKEFREKGLVVMGDSFAASLCVDGSHCYNECWTHAASFITSPPLREGKAIRQKLLQALSDGTLNWI